MRLVLLIVAGLGALARLVAAPLPLVNPGFEQGLTGWHVEAKDPSVAQVTKGAASMGEYGLHLQDTAACPVFTVVSDPVPAQPGKQYALTCWGRNLGKPSALSVKLLFLDAAGKPLKPGAVTRYWDGAALKENDYFGQMVMQGIAPEGTDHLAVQLLSYSRPDGEADIDDFSLAEVTDGKLAEPDVDALLAELKARPTRGPDGPAAIVLKLDDLKPSHGKVHARWLKVVDFLAQRQLKGSFGIIANGLEEDAPEFCATVRKLHDSGAIEFWFHGYDHASWKEGDKQLYEFGGTPQARQQEHFAKSQALAKAKLGFAFTTFGAPNNVADAATVAVFNADPDMHVWLFGKPANDAPGKTFLRRVYCVNIETPTFVANYPAVVEGYTHNRGLAYFVMQGHPTHWDDHRWEQFTRIVSFLADQKCPFVTPSELARRLSQATPTASVN